MPAAFDDLRVLDLSDRLSGAYSARLFGDFGADVLLIEPPEGHALRREPPFAEGVSGPEASLLHAYVNANKRSLTVRDPRQITPHVAAADLIVTTAAPLPGALRAALDAKRPDAVHLSVTPFGLDGPLTGAAGNNLTACAMSGWADICGDEGEPPLQLPPHSCDYIAGVSAFVGAAGALLRRRASGQGELVDAGEAEAAIVTTIPWSLAAVYEGPGGHAQEVHTHHRDHRFYRAADGEIMIGLGPGPFWIDAMHALDLPELADDRFADPLVRRAHVDEFQPRIEERVAQLPRFDVFETLSSVRSRSGVVEQMSDLLADRQLRSRGYFVETEVAGGTARVPGAPAKLGATPWAARRGAPRLGDAAAEAWSDPRPPSPAPGAVDAAPVEAPLSGVRVLTFTQAWTGPLGTELLALLGADVVQIEARSRPDVWRTYAGMSFASESGGYRADIPAGIADPGRRQRAWNTMGLYNGTNLHKRAITLDMRDPRGADLFWRLVPRFDVVAENFRPHVMTNWGVTFEALRAARPDVIFASLSGYGATGPYASFAANGESIEPMSGFASLHGRLGGPPQNSGGLLPDPVGGLYLATAILAALHHRARSGEGQQIDISMVEAMTAHFGDAVLEHALNGVVRGPSGNRHPRVAPHGVYPARDGRWIAIAAETDDAWRALAGQLGRPQLAGDPRFASAAARKAHEDELDAAIAIWSGAQDADDAAGALRGLGCAAAPVARVAEVVESPHPHFVERGFMAEVAHPEAGSHPLAIAPWKFSGRSVANVRPAPCMGEHSFEVLHEEVGLSESEYNALVEAGVTGDMPPD